VNKKERMKDACVSVRVCVRARVCVCVCVRACVCVLEPFSGMQIES
jgi:hypothetical protein